jgi:hypothetical protein
MANATKENQDIMIANQMDLLAAETSLLATQSGAALIELKMLKVLDGIKGMLVAINR